MAGRTGFLRKPFLYILFSLFILWIILFEFILPKNFFLPKPDIVILSVPALFEDYNLIANFFVTISAVYLPPLLAYLFIYPFRQSIFKKSGTFNIFIDFMAKLSAVFPAILLGILFILWLPHSFVLTYLYSFIISILWWLVEINKSSNTLNGNYQTAFRSLGADETFINKNILWNEVKPGLFSKLNRFHLDLWSLLLIFEFILKDYGLGSVLQQTLTYKDLSALFLIIFLILITISAGYILIRFIENKFIFWSTE